MALPTAAIASSVRAALRTAAPARGAALLEVPATGGLAAGGPVAHPCVAMVTRERAARDPNSALAMEGRAVLAGDGLPVVVAPGFTLVTAHPVTGAEVRWAILSVRAVPGAYLLGVGR